MVIEGQYHEYPSDWPRLKLSDEQSLAFHRLTNPKYHAITRVLYGGQAGGGKSTLISAAFNYWVETYPETRYYIAREVLKDLKESVLLTMFDFFRMTGVRYKYREQHSHIHFPRTDCYIYLLEVKLNPSDPDFNDLGSKEYTAGAVEEGVKIHRRAADILITRTRYKHDVYPDLSPKQLITCNPGPGWIKEDIVKPTLEHGQAKRKNDIFIPATLESNPNQKFREAYKKTLEENTSAYDRERLLKGNWDAQQKTGAEYLKSFNRDFHVKRSVPYDPDLALHVSFDENVNPHITAGIYQIVTGKDQVREVRQIGEVCPRPPHNTRKNACKMIERLFPATAHKGGMFIYGDATSQKNETDKEYGENFFTDVKQYLKAYNPGMRVPSKNPPVVAKGNFIDLILEKEYRKIRLVVDEVCEICVNDYAYAMEDAEGGVQKKKVTDPDTGVQYEKHGHGVDQLSYLICFAFSGDFAFYQNGSQNPTYETGLDRQHAFAGREF